MAIRAGLTPSEGFELVKARLRELKAYVDGRSALITGGADAPLLQQISDTLRAKRVTLVALAQTPGLTQWAKDQFDDQNYSIGTEWTALQTAIDAAIAAWVTNVPKSLAGYAEIVTVNVDGSSTHRSFTGAQVTPIKTALDSISALIED